MRTIAATAAEGKKPEGKDSREKTECRRLGNDNRAHAVNAAQDEPAVFDGEPVAADFERCLNDATENYYENARFFDG